KDTPHFLPYEDYVVLCSRGSHPLVLSALFYPLQRLRLLTVPSGELGGLCEHSGKVLSVSRTAPDLVFAQLEQATDIQIQDFLGPQSFTLNIFALRHIDLTSA